MPVAGAAIQAAVQIPGVIASITDANKRRMIESNLSLLTAQEQQDLAEQMARQSNKNAQVTLLLNAVMQARNAAADREQRSQTIKWVIVGVAGISLLGLLIWYYKR